MQGDLCTHLQESQGAFCGCFPRYSVVLAVDRFMVFVVLGNPRVLDQLMAWGAPRSSQINISVCLGLENAHQGWTVWPVPRILQFRCCSLRQGRG